MKLYQEMFGCNFNLGFDVDDYPFLTDKSYRNDSCPSFYFDVGGTYYILWVDYPDVSDREDESYSRYTVVEALNIGEHESPEIEANHDSSFQVELEGVDDIREYLRKAMNDRK